MLQDTDDQNNDRVEVANATGTSSVVVVCDHASDFIPEPLGDLGLTDRDRKSHAVWDPGARAVALGLAARLDAVLIASGVSRLVVDCNRPPDAADAMPELSEVVHVPGNMSLSAAERAARFALYYLPFHAKVCASLDAVADPVLVTVHSFTPVYHGQHRSVEIGVLHDSDARFADAMLRVAAAHTDANVQRNQPYGPSDGVTHTIVEHGVNAGRLNVMLEIRSDLIETPPQQDAMSAALAAWIADAFAQLDVPGDVRCQV